MILKRIVFMAICFCTVTCICIASGIAFAFTAPATSDTLYEIYDVLVNDIIKGPLGFTAAVALLANGFIQLGLGNGIVLPIASILSGAILFKSDDIIESLGYAPDLPVSLPAWLAGLSPELVSLGLLVIAVMSILHAYTCLNAWYVEKEQTNE